MFTQGTDTVETDDIFISRSWVDAACLEIESLKVEVERLKMEIESLKESKNG
jgi:hypothetical protein